MSVFFGVTPAMAQDSSSAPDSKTYVSPYYFGPNAFPIPDILTHTSAKLRIELCGDYYHGTLRKDHTSDILLRTNIPLWTDRANLSLWWVVNEWYDDGVSKGSMGGDVCLSIDMQIFKEKKLLPFWTLRAALKTASGGGFHLNRYYDSAGYFFDTYFGKNFRLGRIGLEICGGGGFLCWQTDNGQQNDAVQYGLLVGLHAGRFHLTESFSGYAGWQSTIKEYGHLVHDCPMSLKTKLAYNLGKWDLLAAFQYGLKDYPYYQLQIGASYSIDILPFMNRTRNKKD